jgi:hypothetical protein
MRFLTSLLIVTCLAVVGLGQEKQEMDADYIKAQINLLQKRGRITGPMKEYLVKQMEKLLAETEAKSKEPEKEPEKLSDERMEKDQSIIKRYIQNNANDADSVQYIQFFHFPPKEDGSRLVDLKCRSANAFGGRMIQLTQFKIQDEKVIKVTEIHEWDHD